MQLPESLCHNIKLNYTLLVRNRNDDTVCIKIGPFQHVGAGYVKRNVSSNLMASQQYSIKVQVQTPDFQIFTSAAHNFSKSIDATKQ